MKERFELNIKTFENIEKIAQLLLKYNIKKVSITNKESSIPSLIILKKLKEIIPDLDILLIYSISVNFEKNDSIESMGKKFNNFINEARVNGVIDFLIVSGNPKKIISTIEVLNYFRSNNFEQKFSVAFNPFLNNYLGDDERSRIQLKLGTGKVNGIYFQIGENILKLREGYNFLNSKTENKIYGSVILPNLKVLNGFKYRKWKGVELSEKFLNDLNYAKKSTKEIIDFYRKNDVDLYIILQPFTEKQIEDLLEILN